MAKIAIVTGAGSGIGRAVTLGLLNRGDNVVLAGRRRDKLEETLALAARPQNGLAVQCDVREEAAVAALFGTAVKTFGRVDFLFNNAGIFGPPVPFGDVALADWSATMDVNLTGAFLCAREAFRVMKAQNPQGGRIVNNGSVAAHVPRPHSAAYSASKHAITGLTKAIALDGRSCNIACGQIDIGNASTDLADILSKGTLQANGTLASEPMMDVAHAAEAVLYMAGLPLSANVPFMTVMATAMPLLGRG